MQVAKVCFLVDFRGKLTNEVYFLAGSTAEFDSGVASQLVAEGRAVYVEDEEQVSEEKPKRGRKPKA